MILDTPVDPFELIGRERETRELRRFVEQLPNGAQSALVRGEPAFGKTMIWRDAVAAAEAAGVKVLPIRCAQVEMPMALGALSDLLEGAFGEIADDLAGPSGERWRRRSASKIRRLSSPTVSRYRERSLPDCGCLRRGLHCWSRSTMCNGWTRDRGGCWRSLSGGSAVSRSACS